MITEQNNILNIDIDGILAKDAANRIDLPKELNFMNRMKKGNVSLACAKTGVGKSLFLRQFGMCMAEKYKVLYISLENDLATDMEHFKTLLGLYHPTNFYYYRAEVWKNIKNKANYKDYDIVCVDGLETTIDASADNSFEIYRNEVTEIKNFFSSSCVWLSWQMGRQFSKEEPTIEDIAFSYAAARLAYSAVAIYNKNEEKHIKNIKGRGGNNISEGIIAWGRRFVSLSLEEEDICV